MNKICLMPKNISELNLDVDSFIIGYKNFNSLNTLELDINEIKEILKNTNKEIYISLNKVIHDTEIEELESILKKLNSIEISGILFDDLSILQIVKENNFSMKLIWSNIHQTTNYNTINSYYNYNISGAVTSPEITLNEIIEIKNNTKSKLFVPLYGMFEIFSSNRFLLSSYFTYINEKKENNTYFINNKILYKNYPIYEDRNGTHIINSNIMNGLDEYVNILENDIDYIIINSYMIDNIKEVIDSFNKVRKMYIDNNIDYEKIKDMSTKLGSEKEFLNKMTIYKIKSSDVNEK